MVNHNQQEVYAMTSAPSVDLSALFQRFRGGVQRMVEVAVSRGLVERELLDDVPFTTPVPNDKHSIRMLSMDLITIAQNVMNKRSSVQESAAEDE